MDADLVGATGEEADVEEGLSLSLFYDGVMELGMFDTVSLPLDYIGLVLVPIMEQEIFQIAFFFYGVTFTGCPVFFYESIGLRQGGGGGRVFGEDHETRYLFIQSMDRVYLLGFQEIVHCLLAACISACQDPTGLGADNQEVVLVNYIRSSIFHRILSHCSKILPKS